MKTWIRRQGRNGPALGVAAALLYGCGAHRALVPGDGGAIGVGGSSAGSSGVGGSSGVAGAVVVAGVDSGAPDRSTAVPSLDASLEPEAGPPGPSESWTGSVEDYAFPSGSNALKLTFATDDDGHVVGTLVFGQGTPPPPATDPNVGYPPGLPPANASRLNTAYAWVSEGFAYAFDGGTFAAPVLRFDVDLAQLWTGWCALETSPDGSGLCLPDWDGRYSDNDCALLNPTTQKYESVDCGKVALCQPRSPCNCVGTGPCTVSTNWDHVAVDLIINGNTANGMLNGGGPLGGRNVFLTKN